MFLTHRPTKSAIEKFIDESSNLPLSYHPVGLARESPPGFNADMASAIVGHGAEVFARARRALTEWRHFELGWVELFPQAASIEPGTVVAVLVHHLGLWSLNGCRVVYELGDEDVWRFGFAYGTLTNHVEMGEESFEVSMARDTEEVTYQIRAVSKPRAVLARIGYPYARISQSRFRRDSIAALKRAIGVT
ncbi:MAG TPA: DUF1990 domain-containing protein [Pyrinomonadaceae bacterium]|nr:DUF1990 domain-containing protein [Pyrinomonadaceae bacterium]